MRRQRPFVGSLRRVWYECGDRRRHESFMAAVRGDRRLGRRLHPHAYMAERGPITEQVSRFAMNHALGAIRHRRDVPAAVEAPGDEGRLAREQFGRAVYDLNVRQYCCGGLNFGYFYDRSPIIMYDGEQAPTYTMGTFTSTTVPGCRAPHVWIE